MVNFNDPYELAEYQRGYQAGLGKGGRYGLGRVARKGYDDAKQDQYSYTSRRLPALQQLNTTVGGFSSKSGQSQLVTGSGQVVQTYGSAKEVPKVRTIAELQRQNVNIQRDAIQRDTNYVLNTREAPISSLSKVFNTQGTGYRDDIKPIQSGVRDGLRSNRAAFLFPPAAAILQAEEGLQRSRKKLGELTAQRTGQTSFKAEAREFGYAVLVPFVDLGLLGTGALTKPKRTFFNVVGGIKKTFNEGLPEIGETIRQQPSKAAGIVTGNIVLAKIPDIGLGTSDIARTFGKMELPATDIIAPEFFAGQTYPRIKKGSSAGNLLQEFKKPILPSEFNTDFKAAGLTASPGSFSRKTLTQRGSSEIPGLYQAPRLSPQFLRVASENEKSLIGLSPIGTIRPTALRITPIDFEFVPNVKPSTTNIKKLSFAKSFFEDSAEKGKSYIPFVKTEKEAIIPFDTGLSFKSKNYFFKFEGRRVPILEFETLPTRSGKSLRSFEETAFDVSSRYGYAPSSRSIVNPYSSALLLKSSSYSFPKSSNSLLSGSSSFSRSNSYRLPRSNAGSLSSGSYGSYVDLRYPPIESPGYYFYNPFNRKGPKKKKDDMGISLYKGKSKNYGFGIEVKIAPSFTAIIQNLKIKSPLKVSRTFGVTPFQIRGLPSGRLRKGAYYKLTNL